MDQKLLTAIKAIIFKGGDIYKTTSKGLAIIDYCTRLPLKEEIIKLFHNNDRRNERGDRKVIFLN